MKIIVIGHGNFATGIHSSLKLIAGEQEKVDAIDFGRHVRKRTKKKF